MLTLAFAVPTVFAAEGVSASVSLPVKVLATGAVPAQSETYNITLEAKDVNNPMPEGSVDGTYTLSVNGPQETYFPEMKYDQLGFYEYKIYQEIGNNTKAEYDASVYDVLVQVTNNETMDDFDIHVAVYKVGSNFKQEIEFTNNYIPDPPEILPETGDDTDLGLYVGILVVAAVAAILLLVFNKKRKNQN